jgi:hypothetical protein
MRLNASPSVSEVFVTLLAIVSFKNHKFELKYLKVWLQA